MSSTFLLTRLAAPRRGARFLAGLVRHYRHRRQYDHIRNQSDHILDDVGLTRAEIDAKTAWFRR